VEIGGAADVGAALLPSAGAEGLEGEPGGLAPEWSEARRFLGLVGGGGKVEKVVPVVDGWEGTGGSTGAVGAVSVVGEDVEADVFWRFCDGGDLSRPSVLERAPPNS
jgi:hypothetical protein